MLLVGIAPPESDELEGSAFLAVQVFDEKFAGHCAGSVWITVNSAAGVADQSRSQRTQSNQRWCPRCHQRQCTAMELKRWEREVVPSPLLLLRLAAPSWARFRRHTRIDDD